MNKIFKKIIFSVICFLTLISISQAKEVFKLYWETDEYTTEFYTYVSDYYIRNIEYKDGYITMRAEEDNAYLYYYDYNGNLKTKTDLDYALILDLVVYDDDIYALAAYGYTSELYAIKMNSSFEITDYIQFDSSTSVALWSMLHSEIPLFGINLLAVNENGIKVLTVDYNYIDIKTDFSSYSNKDYDEEIMEEYFPELHELDNYYISDVYYYNLKMNDNNIVLSGIKPNECLYTSNTCDYDSTAYMTLQDSDGKELWSKEYTDYKEFINTIFVGKYIVTIGIKDLDDLAPCDIVVIDLDGNIVQTIENENSYYFMQETSKGIIVTNYKESYSDGNDGYDYYDQITSNTEVYQLIYDIEQKINGKGTIEVVSSSLSGESVTFKITPEEGYVLSSVKVTDSDGNVVTFTSNTFTMPSADVTIEATFVVKNPNTKDITIIGILLMTVITGITFICYKKKFGFLK